MTEFLTSHELGHSVYSLDDGETWFYADDNTPVAGNPRLCAQCHQSRTPEGHDACLGEIPGACGACCGHGVEDGYITWREGGRGYISQTLLSWSILARQFDLIMSRIVEDPEAEGVAVSGFLPYDQP